MTCSTNSARRNKFYAENAEQIRKANEGPSGKNDSARNDAVFKERFNAVVTVLSDNTDRCMTQCLNYLTTWDQQGYQEHYLTEYMSEELTRITRSRSDVRAMYAQLPTPSKQYWDCYVSVKKLNNVYEDAYKTAVDYRTHYPDYRGKLSGLSSDYMSVKGELNACKDVVK
jgi:hypothetical protein